MAPPNKIEELAKAVARRNAGAGRPATLKRRRTARRPALGLTGGALLETLAPATGGRPSSAGVHLHLAKTMWHKAGLGQSHPMALYKTTLLSTTAIQTVLHPRPHLCRLQSWLLCPAARLLACRVCPHRFIVSERFTDKQARASPQQQSLQLWLMAWLNPLSLAPGRLPVAVRLVGILSKTCSYTMASPTHAGSGLAAADLMSDAPPMPFARVLPPCGSQSPVFISTPRTRHSRSASWRPRHRVTRLAMYESLLQSALQVGLTTQEMQDFRRRRCGNLVTATLAQSRELDGRTTSRWSLDSSIAGVRCSPSTKPVRVRGVHRLLRRRRQSQ